MLKTNWFLWPARLAWAEDMDATSVGNIAVEDFFVAGGFAIAILPLYPLTVYCGGRCGKLGSRNHNQESFYSRESDLFLNVQQTDHNDSSLARIIPITFE